MRAGKRPRGCRPWPACSGASRIRPPNGVDGHGNPGDCRDQDGELIDQYRGSLEVAEPKLDERATSFVRRHAVAAHDGTGIGNVVNDLIDERAHKFVMVGRKRTELLVEAGEGLHVVAQRLGHKDAMVTATIYAHVTPKQSRQASDTFTRILDI